MNFSSLVISILNEEISERQKRSQALRSAKLISKEMARTSEEYAFEYLLQELSGGVIDFKDLDVYILHKCLPTKNSVFNSEQIDRLIKAWNTKPKNIQQAQKADPRILQSYYTTILGFVKYYKDLNAIPDVYLQEWSNPEYKANSYYFIQKYLLDNLGSVDDILSNKRLLSVLNDDLSKINIIVAALHDNKQNLKKIPVDWFDAINSKEVTEHNNTMIKVYDLFINSVLTVEDAPLSFRNALLNVSAETRYSVVNTLRHKVSSNQIQKFTSAHIGLLELFCKITLDKINDKRAWNESTFRKGVFSLYKNCKERNFDLNLLPPSMQELVKYYYDSGLVNPFYDRIYENYPYDSIDEEFESTIIFRGKQTGTISNVSFSYDITKDSDGYQTSYSLDALEISDVTDIYLYLEDGTDLKGEELVSEELLNVQKQIAKEFDEKPSKYIEDLLGI